MARQKPKHRQHSRLRFRRQTIPGSAPGVIEVFPDAAPTTIHVMSFDATQVEEQTSVPADKIASFMKPGRVTWVHVVGLGNKAALETIARQFQLHPLAMEDVVHVHQRPKIETYLDILFMVLRMPNEGPRFDTDQISLFLGKDWVLTFDEQPGDCWEGLRNRIRKGAAKTRNFRADYLAYCLIDSVIDSYFPILENYTDALDRIEDRLDIPTANETVRAVYELRNELLIVRRTIRPHRDAISSLLRDDQELITHDTSLYLRDCYDHCIQLIELSEVQREICSDLRDLSLSLMSQRMNQVMKLLTVIATIFMPLSFIAGVYGMNFDTNSPWNMPELKWRLGYPLTLAAMATVAGGMLVYFRRRGWLSSEKL